MCRQLFPVHVHILYFLNENSVELCNVQIIRVISKSNERTARVRFEFTSMISDQNCTTRSSIVTLLDPV